jgi:hypothetical protein
MLEGRYPPHAVLTRPVAALGLYAMHPKFGEGGAEGKTRSALHPRGCLTCCALMRQSRRCQRWSKNNTVSVCEYNPTPKLLCNDCWVFRQRSYHGDNVGVYASSSSITSQAGSVTMDRNGTLRTVAACERWTACNCSRRWPAYVPWQ